MKTEEFITEIQEVIEEGQLETFNAKCLELYNKIPVNLADDDRKVILNNITIFVNEHDKEFVRIFLFNLLIKLALSDPKDESIFVAKTCAIIAYLR